MKALILMEITGLGSTQNIPNTVESKPGNKSDCYFYYYSSCNKGNACPFRHEPAALRNETMCLYWLNGSCNKPHCIYRHMEITKNRSKIPCFFESQPGGCKKLHCPFFHNNILDQPREEDVPNKPDLILPVKDSELDYETEESEVKKLEETVAAQLKIHRKLSHSQNSDVKDNVILESQAPSIIRKSFIVPLQDGESDSESVIVTPNKNSRLKERRCIVSEEESDWELKRLKEIQKEEGNLLGCVFTSEDDDDDEEGENDSGLQDSENLSPLIEEVEYIDEEVRDDNEVHTIVRKSFLGNHGKFSDEAHQGNFIKRVLGNTLLTKSKNSKSRISSRPVFQNKEDSLKNLLIKSPTKPAKQVRPSVKERLGKKHRSEEIKLKGSLSTTKEDDLLQRRLISKDEGIKNRLNANEGKSKVKLSTSEREKEPNFIIKSLADIKAEKLQKTNGRLKKNSNPSTELLSLSSLINKKNENTKNSPDVNSIKIKTLAEIKAEKGKGSSSRSQNVTTSHAKVKKRAYSPIRFDASPVKKIKSAPSNSEEKTDLKRNVEVKNSSEDFVPRKLTLKRRTAESKEQHKGNDASEVIIPKSRLTLANNHNTENNSISRTKGDGAPTMLKKFTENYVNSRNPSETEANGVALDPKESTNIVQTTTIHPVDSNSSSSNHRRSSNGSNTEGVKTTVNRLDSLLDEEELLLEDDVSQYDEDEINEDELLL